MVSCSHCRLCGIAHSICSSDCNIPVVWVFSMTEFSINDIWLNLLKYVPWLTIEQFAVASICMSMPLSLREMNANRKGKRLLEPWGTNLFHSHRCGMTCWLFRAFSILILDCHVVVCLTAEYCQELQGFNIANQTSPCESDQVLATSS